MKSRREKIPVWMELKLILSPDEYLGLKKYARFQSQSVAEFVKQLIGHSLKAENLKA
jgi:hypothetical protein